MNVKRGRPKGTTVAPEKAHKLQDRGLSQSEIAKRLGISKRTVIRYLKSWKSKEGTPTDVKAYGRIEVWCGDSLQLMDRIKRNSIDVICTSPPFNRGINYGTYKDKLSEQDFDKWIDEVFGKFSLLLKPTGSFFLVVGHSPSHPWTATNMAKIAAKHFQLQNQIVWLKAISINDESKGHFRPIRGERYLNRNWDFVFHFTPKGNAPLRRKAIGVSYVDPNNVMRSGDGEDIRCAGDVWFIPFETIHERSHPATFPAGLTERCLKLAGFNNETKMLDPFCGVNGIKGAVNLCVNAIGIEIDPIYCEAMAKVVGTTVMTFESENGR